METRNRYDGLDPAVVAAVRVHARRLAQNGAIPAAGVDDLEQELMLDLLRRLPRFDPHRAALPTLADRVIAQCFPGGGEEGGPLVGGEIEAAAVGIVELRVETVQNISVSGAEAHPAAGSRNGPAGERYGVQPLGVKPITRRQVVMGTLNRYPVILIASDRARRRVAAG